MKTAYSMQIWTNRNIIRDWFVAENADDAFNRAYDKYPDVTRMAVNHFVPYDQFPHMKARGRTLLREVVIYEYGDTDKGFIAGDDYEIESISTFLTWAANKGADIVAY